MGTKFIDHASYSEAILILHKFIENIETVEHKIPEQTTIDMKNDCMELYKKMKQLNEDINLLNKQKLFYHNLLWKHYYLVQDPNYRSETLNNVL